MNTDEQLRAAYGEAVESRGAPDRVHCVTPEALLALVRRESPEDARLATLDHAMSCPACREEFELLRSIERTGGEGTQRAVEQIRWRRIATMAAAASVVLAVSVGPGRRLWDRDGGDDPMRGGPGDRLAVVAPAAGASLGRAPVTFTWRAVPGARGYTFEVLSSGGAVALTRQTSDTTIVMTSSGTLTPGEYRWLVRARGEDGSEWRSGARPLRVTR